MTNTVKAVTRLTQALHVYPLADTLLESVYKALSVQDKLRKHDIELVDHEKIGPYEHFHIAVSGEHSETNHSWKGRIVKNPFFNPKCAARFEEALHDILGKASCRLVSLNMIFFHDDRKFGFSVIVGGE